jgi:ParB-like chromosome segregation protein Spo0J
MELLQRSILANGFCFPIVAIWDDESELFVIIDGFHRYSMGDESWLDLDYIPLVVLPHGMAQRLSATMQFNKARGVHQVDLDAELIRRLVDQGLDDEEIAVNLGVDVDTVYRYKQITGIAELFKNSGYSPSWELVEDDNG